MNYEEALAFVDSYRQANGITPAQTDTSAQQGEAAQEQNTPQKLNLRVSTPTTSRKERRITEEERDALAYREAQRQGQSIDSWYSDSQAAYTGAKDNYDRLQSRLDELRTTKNQQDNGSMFGSVMAKARGEDVSDETLGKYETALEQARAQLEKTEAELKSASRYKTDQDNKNKMNERLVQNGYDYGRVYDEAKATSQQLKQQKEAVDALIRSAKSNLFLNPETGEYEQYKGDIGQYRKELDSRSEVLARLLKEAEDFEDYSFRYIGKGLGAKNAIEKGLAEEGRLLAEQTKAGERVLGESDSEGGISLYTKYRGATRQGTHVTEDWPQEAVDRYHLILGRYGQQAAEEYAGQVNLALNQAKQAAGGGNWWNMGTSQAEALGAQANGTKGQKFAAGAGTLAASLTTPIFHAMSYIDKLSAVAAGVPYTGRDFALPSDLVQAAAKGRAGQLNKDYGTLGKEYGFLAGKGWGDAFQLSQSMVQSLAMGHTIGEVGTLAAFFAQAADTAFDEAKARGGSDQYAAGVSMLAGFAEVIGEKVSLDHLLKGGSWSLSRVLKQAAIEGGEEITTSVLNDFFDRVTADITHNQSAIDTRIEDLIRGGMSRQDAEKQVWRERCNEIAWDFVGGFVSGLGSGVVESGVHQTRNQLWEMRKDSVLGKTNAEGQREGGKTNVSEDALRGLIDRALKRGDLRGAEELAQALQQKTGTAEEQEYGPADPRANEKMQGRLERQLNGERVNPRENAEVEGETEAKTPPALPEEFKDLNPVVAQQFARYEGRDLEMITRSIMPQAAYRYEQYLRAIGQTEKADLVERIRTDPNYHYEEQPPAYTDAEDHTRQRQQEAAGQQEAPGGQITQPQTQEAAGVVKPQDSAQQNNTLYNITQNPYGVSTNGTESGTIAAQTNQEVNNNAGEQTVQQPETAGESAAGRSGAAESGGYASERTGTSESQGQSGTDTPTESGRHKQKRLNELEESELTDTEDTSPPEPQEKNDLSDITPGTVVIRKPARNSPAFFAWKLIKAMQLKNAYLVKNANGDAITTGDGYFDDATDAVVSEVTDDAEMTVVTVSHEGTHKKINDKYGNSAANGSYSSRYKLFSGIFFRSFRNAAQAATVMRKAEQYILNDLDYKTDYASARAGNTYLAVNELMAKGMNLAAAQSTAANLVDEQEKAEALEEFFNYLISEHPVFSKEIAAKLGISHAEIEKLREKAKARYVSEGVYQQDEADAIKTTLEEARQYGGSKVNTTSQSQTNASRPGVSPQKKIQDLNGAIRAAASGNASALLNQQLISVLEYALDRATPETRSQPISDRLADLYLNHADELGSNGAAAWSEETGYQNNTVGKLDTRQTSSLIGTVSAVLQEMDKRGISINSLQSNVTDYENKFGMVFDENDNLVDLSQNPKDDTSRKEDSDWKSEAETEADYDRRNMKRDVDALRNGTNYVKEAVPTKPEDHGWIKPVEVSQKEVTRARDAVEAKDKLEEYKAKKALLQAHLDYYASVVDAMREAREATYEQKVADLGYLADNVKEELEWLDEDMDKVASGVIGVEEEAVIDDIAIEKGNLNVQLDALRDEYKHLDKNDPESYQIIRKQIDSVLSQINVLNVRINNLSKRAAAADWGSNKRTLFQAEMAENPNGLRQEQTMPEPNVYGPYTNQALNKAFRHLSAQKRITDTDDSADINEPTRGMGTGYRGMQTSRNKDGSLEFRTMYDDALPTRPATDKSRKAINAPSTAYGSVAQAARSILNSKSSFFDFSANRPKDIPSKVTNAMGQLHEHVREMMEGEHPVNALMQISNMIREFENDDDLKVFTSDSIQKAVAELNDIYYNQDITNEEKAKRMVENATKTLSLISKRVQLEDRGYHMLKSFVGPRKKRDNTDFWSKYKAMQLNPSTLFKAMDGFARDKNGSGYQIAKMIENGTALYTITQAQALQKLSAISGMEGFKEFSEGNTKPFDIDGVKITEQQAVEFIMQVRNLLATEVTGNDGPTNRLNTIEGFSIRDKDGKSTFIERSNDADGTNAEWFANLAEAFENSLSPAAKKYLEAATEILDELGQQASDIRTNLIGTGFDGSINGTYYPITYDNKNGKNNSQQSQPTGLASGPMYQSRTRNVGGYVNIKNASDTLDKYIHWASNFIGYGEVAELLRAMDNTGGRMQNLSSLADDMLGKGYRDYIEKFVNDVNEVPDGQKDNDSVWSTLRRNMAAGALLGNLGVAAKQAASLWSAAGVLSPQAILSAETWFGKYSGAGNMLLQSRKIGTSLDPTISEILHNDSFMGKLMKRTRVSEFMGKATALVDYQTVKRLFAATVVDTKLSFPGLDQNSELFAQAVEAKFQDVVLQTQPIFVKNARAGYLRANDELTKAFAMFRTQPTQNLNAIVTAIGEYNALKGTEYGKAAGKKLRNTIIGQTASAVTFAVLSSLVGFARHGWKKFRDDDDELSWLEVAKRIGLDSVESLAGLTVVGGDIAKAIITMATGGEEKEFYDMNTGVLSMLGDTLSSVTTFGTNVVKAIQEDKPLAVFNAGRQAADNLLQVGLGIPANTVYRLLNTITMYSADALYALSDGKLGNRANYDDAMKMLDSYIKGNLTEEGAKTQAAKAFRKGQPENLLYNLGILSSLSTSDTDKGRVWLQNHLPKDEDKSVNRRILDYLISNAVSNEQMDEAVEKYVTADGFNAMYAAVRDTGVSPQSAIATIDAADGNKNGEFTQNELWEYYKANQSKDKQVGAMFDAKGYTKDGQPRTWDSYKAEQERKEFKTVVDTNSNGRLTQAELLEYYRAHPDEEDKIKELWESNGWKTTWSAYKAKNAS